LLFWAIYKQLFYKQSVENLIDQFKGSITVKSTPFFVVAFLLVIANYLCEVQKWRTLMKVFFKVKYSTAIKAILVGITVAIFTPNRIGEYAGRVLYIPKKYAVETVAVTIVGSISQMIVILFFGLASFSGNYYCSINRSLFYLLRFTLGLSFIWSIKLLKKIFIEISRV